MATLYQALTAIYVEGRYISAGQTFGTDSLADIPVSASYRPSPAANPLNADAIAALTAAYNNFRPPPCVLGVFGLALKPSAAWISIFYPV